MATKSYTIADEDMQIIHGALHAMRDCADRVTESNYVERAKKLSSDISDLQDRLLQQQFPKS